MDKKHEQDFADLEVKSGFAGCLVRRSPRLPPERDKALDKVKEPPRTSRSWNGRSGDKETPPAPSIFM